MVPEPRRPVNEPSLGFGPDIRLAIELDHVTLAIIEANGLHMLEPVQGPGKTGVLSWPPEHNTNARSPFKANGPDIGPRNQF